MKPDVIIVGAGASGLMCAIEAGKRGRNVLIIEHSGRICSKILISGGGRCNFTNRIISPENYISNNPHFCKSALSRFTPSDFISMVERHRIEFHEKENGQMFSSGSSEEIIRMLKCECDGVGVKFTLNCKIAEVDQKDRFRILTDHGMFQSESLVIAAGGLSAPKIGATNFGYTLARQFGIKVTPLKPALTPLRFKRSDIEAFRILAGISIDSEVSCSNARFHDSILFTHNGLSGPAILQVSSYWNGKDPVIIDLLPNINIQQTLVDEKNGKIFLSTLLTKYLPARFVKVWCNLYCTSKPINQYSLQELYEIANRLHNWQIKPASTAGFDKAEVTLGGVDTYELSSKTMETKRISGLYFVGEVIDVTGHLGGYNLHWAWASGYAAGQFA